MRILFFSDVHGDPSSMEYIFERSRELQADKFVFLGDALYHGPRNPLPGGYNCMKTVEYFNSIRENILAVRGNCDADVEQMLLQFPMMGDYALLHTEKMQFFLTHGHIWNENTLPPVSGGTVLVHGHTHIPVCKEIEKEGKKILIFNPGSATLPKGGFERSFGFYDGETLSLRLLKDGSIFQA
ncbi:MAG: phosphodiesterase [Lentisphaeria bacterium]|nr:phosphodiesterase [Lentisphaeria bacterium]